MRDQTLLCPANRMCWQIVRDVEQCPWLSITYRGYQVDNKGICIPSTAKAVIEIALHERIPRTGGRLLLCLVSRASANLMLQLSREQLHVR
jgi:hypothetical protein